MKYWEIIADNLHKAGWSWGCVSALDAHGYGKRLVVRADEKLAALVELEALDVQGFDSRLKGCNRSGKATN